MSMHCRNDLPGVLDPGASHWLKARRGDTAHLVMLAVVLAECLLGACHPGADAQLAHATQSAVPRATYAAELLLNEQFATLESRFDGTLRMRIGATQVEHLWRSLYADLGQFLRYEDARRYHAKDYTVDTVIVRFQRGLLEVRVSWSAHGKMSAFFVRPGSISLRALTVARSVLRGDADALFEQFSRPLRAALPRSALSPMLQRIHDELGPEPEVQDITVRSADQDFASEIEPRVSGLVLLATPSRAMEDVILEQTRYLISLAPHSSSAAEASVTELERKVARVKSPQLASYGAADLPLGVPASWWLSLRGESSIARVLRLKLPTLVLQGDRDFQVTAGDFELWRAALEPEAWATVALLRGLNHIFVEGSGPATPAEYAQPGYVSGIVVDRIAAWLLDLKTSTQAGSK